MFIQYKKQNYKSKSKLGNKSKYYKLTFSSFSTYV